MKYTIKGYTGAYPDFTDTIEIPDSFKLPAYGGCEHTSGENIYYALKPLLLDTDISTDYLDVFDYDVMLASDLAEHDGQIVLLASGLGCENCAAQGLTEYIDGCDDVPHDSFMLVLEPEVK